MKAYVESVGGGRPPLVLSVMSSRPFSCAALRCRFHPHWAHRRSRLRQSLFEAGGRSADNDFHGRRDQDRTPARNVELHGRHSSVVSIDGQEGSECGTPRVLQLQSGNSTEGIYDSWKEGADVIVRDERGSIIGTDILTSGIATAMDGDTVTTCVFTFFGRCADRREELSGRGR
jgi:hypothetical protein